MPKAMEMIDMNEERKKEAIKSMNIYEKMLHIQSEIPTVAKNLDVDTGSYNRSYKAVSERDVKDAVKPLEEKYGVYSFPYKKELIEQTFLEQSTKNGTRKSFYIRERVTYRFVNIHKPEEFIEIDGYGDGIDTSDKSPGKADTYASKYCLMSAYKISTGDDPDKEASQEYSTKSPTAPAQYNQADMAVEYSNITRELAKKGVDVHDPNFIKFVCDTAKVNTVDGGALLTDLPAMARVIAVMKGVLSKK